MEQLEYEVYKNENEIRIKKSIKLDDYFQISVGEAPHTSTASIIRLLLFICYCCSRGGLPANIILYDISKEQMESEKKIYLLIPYEKKDELKKLYKIKWDAKTKLWYIAEMVEGLRPYAIM